MLKPIVLLATELMSRLDFANYKYVLDTDTKLAILVVPRLVRQCHAWSQCNLVVRRTRSTPLWALVNVQESTYSMTGAMSKVQPIGPQSPSRENVQDITCCPLREDCGIDGNMTLEHTRETSLLVCSRCLEMERAGDIGCSVQVLSARITKVDQAGIDARCSWLLWFIVDDGSVRSCGRDGVE